MAAVAYGPPNAALVQLKPRNGLLPSALTSDKPGRDVVEVKERVQTFQTRGGGHVWHTWSHMLPLTYATAALLVSSRQKTLLKLNLLPCFLCFFLFLFLFFQIHQQGLVSEYQLLHGQLMFLSPFFSIMCAISLRSKCPSNLCACVLRFVFLPRCVIIYLFLFLTPVRVLLCKITRGSYERYRLGVQWNVQ